MITSRAGYYSAKMPSDNPMRAWITRQTASWNYFKGRTFQFLACAGRVRQMPRLVFSNFPICFNSMKHPEWLLQMHEELFGDGGVLVRGAVDDNIKGAPPRLEI